MVFRWYLPMQLFLWKCASIVWKQCHCRKHDQYQTLYRRNVFLQSFHVFWKIKIISDFPIITKTYPNEREALIEISKRAPRNEVARFILSDLDKAIEMMQNIAPSGGKNRLSKDCAILLKSRVALYEGSWLKNFKGTAFVPNGPDGREQIKIIMLITHLNPEVLKKNQSSSLMKLLKRHKS